MDAYGRRAGEPVGPELLCPACDARNDLQRVVADGDVRRITCRACGQTTSWLLSAVGIPRLEGPDALDGA